MVRAGLGKLQRHRADQRRRRLRDSGGAGTRGRFRIRATGRVHAGDELVLAGSTRFMVIEGMPESWE